MLRAITFISMLFILALSAPPAWAQDNAPEITTEGLSVVKKKGRTEIYADPNVDWNVYTKVRLDPASVAFRKNWQRDQNRSQPFKIRTEDMERIKSELSELFGEVFTKELSENGGYTITDESGDDVLRITPHIVDLDVAAPDARNSPGMQKSYTDSAGRMTLKMQLFDSVTGDLIAVTSDREEAPRRGYMQWTTSVSNRREAKMLMERWAKDMRERLDEARTSGTPAD